MLSQRFGNDVAFLTRKIQFIGTYKHTHIYFPSLYLFLANKCIQHMYIPICVFLYIMIVGRRKNKNMQQLLPVSPSCRPTIIINKKDIHRNVHECVCECVVCMYKRERETEKVYIYICLYIYQ